MNRLDLINPLTDEQKAECDAHIARECERIQATWTEHERQCRSYTRPFTLVVDVAARWRAGS